MKIKNENSTIVIVGAWNKNIFNPEWVSKYLFPDQDIRVEIPINVEGSPLFITDNVKLSVIGNKLSFVSLKVDDQNLDYLEEIANKVADYLPHTPVSAFGINISFEDELSDRIEKLIHLNDSVLLVEQGFKIKSLQRKYCLENDDRIINLNVQTEGQIIKLLFNYHFSIRDLVQFKEKISENSMLDLRENAISILENVYSSSID